MENFCNIPSEQSEKKTHMGYSFVSFGRIMDADAASVTIKSVSEKPKNQIFTLTNHFYENGGTDPRKMVGKHVRFFGVKWYDSGYKNDIDFEGTEIFLIQEEQDVNRLKVEEILGHIRLRANVSVKEAEKFEGKSVFYSVRNKEDFKDKNISIFGGGDSALDWTVELSKFSKVNLIHRRDEFRGAPHTLSEIKKMEKEGKVSIKTFAQKFQNEK